jgi:D-glycero-D-manno-heptose 1,7-bisphosphate phosphatase
MKMETDLGKQGAFIDDLFFCPHHTDKGFAGELPELKFDCDCRKPKPGMILQAAQKYNIDLSKSYMVGDHKRDIQAGINAGCTAVFLTNNNPFEKIEGIDNLLTFKNLKDFTDSL